MNEGEEIPQCLRISVVILLTHEVTTNKYQKTYEQYQQTEERYVEPLSCLSDIPCEIWQPWRSNIILYFFMVPKLLCYMILALITATKTHLCMYSRTTSSRFYQSSNVPFFKQYIIRNNQNLFKMSHINNSCW